MSLFSALGSALGGLLGYAGQSSANSTQSDLLERQIEWQKEVLQNKYQWSVEDMKAAGLNPLLSVMSGSSSVSGSAPSVSAPQVQNPMQAASNSAAAVANMVNQAKSVANDTMRADSEVQVNSAKSNQLYSESRRNDSIVESGLYNAQSAREVASAAESYQQIEYLKRLDDKLTQDIKESQTRMDVMRQEIIQMAAQVDNLREQNRYLKEQGNESRSRQALYAAESALSAKRAELAELEKETEFFKAQQYKVDIDLKQLEAPKRVYDADYYASPWGKFMRGFGNARREVAGGR